MTLTSFLIKLTHYSLVSVEYLAPTYIMINTIIKSQELYNTRHGMEMGREGGRKKERERERQINGHTISM